MLIREEYREEAVIRKSRFLACLKPVFQEEEARAYIEQIRHEFPDASHVCTAYVIGDHDEITRSSDNREPAGTAGVPMLEAIRQNDIHNVCACTVRWFGGIKLGAGGLARAYGGSVSSAIHHAEKGELVTYSHWRLTYPYSLTGTLENWLRSHTEITDLLYDEDVTASILTDQEDFPQKIKDLSNGEVLPEYLGSLKKIRPVTS